MEGLALNVDTAPTRDDLAVLDDGLTRHAAPSTEGPGFLPLAVFLRDPDARVVGGAYGRVNWTWLHVSLLWVSPERRGGGLGTRLLAAIEEAAAERGCRQAHLDTFSYQAPDFYRRRGYEVFAELDDYPPGYRRLFMRKRL